MPDTTDITSASTVQPPSHGATSRRTLALGGVAAAIAGLIAAPSVASAAAANTNIESIDAALIQLCAWIVADCNQQAGLQDRMLDLLPDDPDHDMVERRIQELIDETRQLAGRIAQLPALTTEGVQARAAAIRAMMPVDFGVDDMVPIGWHGGMLDALLGDLIGRA